MVGIDAPSKIVSEPSFDARVAIFLDQFPSSSLDAKLARLKQHKRDLKESIKIATRAQDREAKKRKAIDCRCFLYEDLDLFLASRPEC